MTASSTTRALPPPLRAVPDGATQVPATGAVARGRRRRFRAIWIPDTRLGAPECQARALLEFPGRAESEYRYLVGDLIDGWQLKRRWYGQQTHNDAIRKVLRKARQGAEVSGPHTQGRQIRASTRR
jgi:hypothetical protein